MNCSPTEEEYLHELLNSAKGGRLKIESLDAVHHFESYSDKSGVVQSKLNGRHTITIETQDKKK